MISNKEYFEAVDTVCMNCAFGEETCEVCPVRKTIEKVENACCGECRCHKEEKELNTYTVVIHYEGGCSYDVKAKNEDEAKEIASSIFEDADPMDLWDNVDWDVCDCWEER